MVTEKIVAFIVSKILIFLFISPISIDGYFFPTRVSEGQPSVSKNIMYGTFLLWYWVNVSMFTFC